MLYRNKILSIFAPSSFVRAEWPENVRAIFLAPKISGVALPSVSYNDLLSPDKGLDNGEGDTVFLLPVLKLIEMSKTLSGAIGSSLAISAESIIQDLILTDDLKKMRCHLRDLADSYLLSEDDPAYRRSVYSTYMALDTLLLKIEQINI